MIEWMPAHALLAAYAKRTASPVEVIRTLLARIERSNVALGAFLAVDPDDVLLQARRAEAALFADEPLGSLHGVPISIKDTIDTAGLRSTSGSLLRVDDVPAQDAAAVRRLRAAGAIILGKTNTSEFAASARTSNRLGPETVNPWDRSRTAGGSSGGAGAAVAAGLGPIGIGTDAGGSIRFPAAFNGVFGLMPSYGLVAKAGCLEADQFGSVFSTIGPLSRDVRDAAIALQAMAGYDPSDPISSRREIPDYAAACDGGVRDVTIGWVTHAPDVHREPGVEEAVRAACNAFSELGAAVRDVDTELVDPFPISAALLMGGTAKLKRLASEPIARGLMTPYAAQFVSAPAVSAEDEARAWTRQRELVARMDALFGEFRILAAPTTCFTAPVRPRDPFEPYMDLSFIRLPMVANVAGLPAVSIPCGFHEGRPIGLMLMAPRAQEARLFRAAATFERERPWAEARPPRV